MVQTKCIYQATFRFILPCCVLYRFSFVNDLAAAMLNYGKMNSMNVKSSAVLWGCFGLQHNFVQLQLQSFLPLSDIAYIFQSMRPPQTPSLNGKFHFQSVPFRTVCSHHFIKALLPCNLNQQLVVF